MAHRDMPVWDKDWTKDKRKPKKWELIPEQSDKDKEKRKKDSSRRRSKRRRDNYYYDDEDYE